MSRVLSFSTDKEFANLLDHYIGQSGYKNRSLFLRDASIHFAESLQRGELISIDDEVIVEGTVVIYYQHGVENKLMDLRHSHEIEVFSYHHNCLTASHTCVDTMQVKGKASSFKHMLDFLNNTRDVDKVNFIAAPVRKNGCC